MHNLAPIGISTYARLGHLKKTIHALRRNPLAKESDLYIFSDAPRPGDEKKVCAIRDFIITVSGFKSVTIIEREENNRVLNNRGGMRSLIDQYGKMIWLEEDIVTSPSFLNFMNQALDVYADNQDIISISGYCPPISIPKDYPYDVFILPRFCAWGFGIWKDRFDRIEMHLNRSEVYGTLANPITLYKFTRGGWDLTQMVIGDAKGIIDALDAKIIFHQYKWKLYTVYPTYSLIQNTGHDGSGIHCGSSDRFLVKLHDGQTINFQMPNSLQLDPFIVKSNLRFRSGGWHRKLKILAISLKRLFSKKSIYT